ncbi:Uncharacterised protein [Candidatus Ornithobacterium hominis]|uniref:Lipoprotein n=1 Tax=Candidatus Ornithobacterium hominis TaxID=2497989 RepID=A0A383U4Z4_9FLAO|nr:hypothetical protein [Candidatus Ornithobacterium hominis]MCT7905245.1 hypothetical protein [Candidatus Ornithobacterium hominis]SZD74356.1 Uncharacterised protein [Candidatus Ornithobacterium hominis]
MKTNLRTLALCLVLGAGFISVTSCNSDDVVKNGKEEVTKPDEYTYSPPDWIQGEWKIVTDDEEEDDYGWMFNKKYIFPISKDIDNKLSVEAIMGFEISQEEKNAEKIDNKNKTYQILVAGITKFEFHLNKNGILEVQEEGPGGLDKEGNIISKKVKKTYKRSEKPFNIKYFPLI